MVSGDAMEQLKKSHETLQRQFDEADKIIEELGKSGLKMDAELSSLRSIISKLSKVPSEIWELRDWTGDSDLVYKIEQLSRKYEKILKEGGA